ncbi:MAG: hypothetical protein ACSHX4_13200 [Opitutaceae bacterium]
MTEKKKNRRGFADTAFDMIGAVVPSCGSALKMVEVGKTRSLSLREQFVLLYNSPLCPHCRCNREKFDKERAIMREIRASDSA